MSGLAYKVQSSLEFRCVKQVSPGFGCVLALDSLYVAEGIKTWWQDGRMP